MPQILSVSSFQPCPDQKFWGTLHTNYTLHLLILARLISQRFDVFAIGSYSIPENNCSLVFEHMFCISGPKSFRSWSNNNKDDQLRISNSVIMVFTLWMIAQIHRKTLLGYIVSVSFCPLLFFIPTNE